MKGKYGFKEWVIVSVLVIVAFFYGNHVSASTIEFTPEELDKIVLNAKVSPNLSTVNVESLDDIGRVVKRFKPERDLVIQLDDTLYGLYRPIHIGHHPEPPKHFHTWKQYKNVNVVPIPAAVWLFASGLISLGIFRKFSSTQKV